MPGRDLAPKGKVEYLRERIEAFAKENSLVIFEKNAFKIDWMIEHEGRCFCDWQNRKCPCDNVFQDIAKFNGNCLCCVFATGEKAEILSKPRKIVVRTPEEMKAYKEKMKQKQADNEKLFTKLFRKKKRRDGGNVTAR